MKKYLLLITQLLMISVVFADVNVPKEDSKNETKNKQKTDNFQLFYAAHNGDIEKVKELIAKGCNINDRDEYNWTPLHAALNSGHKDIAKLLIENGADVNIPNDHGVLPVMLAIITKNNDIADMLISKGAEKTIYVAAAMGDVESVKNLLRQNPELVNTIATNDGWAALHWAAYLDRPEVIKALVERGANVNILNKKYNRVTPLHWAVRMGNVNSAKVLIANGGDVNFKIPGGGTLLHFPGNLEIAQLLIDNGADVNARAVLEFPEMTPLHSIACEGGLLIVQRGLFSKTGGTNATDFEKLRKDAEKMTAGIAELLLKKGADINAKTANGTTALMLAIQSGNIEIAKLLVQKGADVNISNNEGKTALELAKSQSNKDIEQLLEKASSKK